MTWSEGLPGENICSLQRTAQPGFAKLPLTKINRKIDLEISIQTHNSAQTTTLLKCCSAVHKRMPPNLNELKCWCNVAMINSSYYCQMWFYKLFNGILSFSKLCTDHFSTKVPQCLKCMRQQINVRCWCHHYNTENEREFCLLICKKEQECKLKSPGLVMLKLLKCCDTSREES